MRRAVNPDAEVHHILSAGGASGAAAGGTTSGGMAAGRRPVVRYGQDLLSPGKHSSTVLAGFLCFLFDFYNMMQCDMKYLMSGSGYMQQCHLKDIVLLSRSGDQR